MQWPTQGAALRAVRRNAGPLLRAGVAGLLAALLALGAVPPACVDVARRLILFVW